MDYEVEQKFRLNDVTKFEARAQELQLQFGEPIRQLDTYYAHPSRDFAVTDEALRTRSIGDSHFITYKGPRIDTTTKTRKELELPLATTAKEFSDILNAVGFEVVNSVHKSRRSASYSLEDRQFTIDVDEVDDLGTFVELETICHKDQVKAATATMAKLAAVLDLSDSERRSYLELLFD